MRRTAWILSATLALALLVPGTVRAGDALFQYAPFGAIKAGQYDGRMTLESLKFKGDFGLGFLNGLDGELTLLEGQAYRAEAGGKVSVPADSTRIPFATVSFFLADRAVELGRIGSRDALNRAVRQALPSVNLSYAIRIDGNFTGVKTRATPRQAAPYQPLAEVMKQQVVTEFSGPGTLVGYYLPALFEGVSMPGFHWHFLTEDRSGGGHVLDLSMDPATARVDTLHGFTVRLPGDRAFGRLDLSGLRAMEEDKDGRK